jgi:chromosome segregation ATPase
LTHREDPHERTVYVDLSEGTGLSRSQFHKIMEAITVMSENLDTRIQALTTEIDDLRTTVGLIADATTRLQENLTAAQEANAALNDQVAVLTAGATLSQITIDDLQAQATAAGVAIGDATTGLQELDETLEDATGENTTPEEPV